MRILAGLEDKQLAAQADEHDSQTTTMQSCAWAFLVATASFGRDPAIFCVNEQESPAGSPVARRALLRSWANFQAPSQTRMSHFAC